MDWTKITHFKADEFRCQCCGEEQMDENFVLLLDHMRIMMMKPIVIDSGYRCPKHDKEVGGKGNHTTGKAVDIHCNNARDRYVLLDMALGMAHRIGIGKTFIHLDACQDKPPEVCWLY